MPLHSMDPYHSPQPLPSSSFLPPAYDADEKPDPHAAFMKAPKRKRLAKACDACHKSKRRCDGTAPCSNCYYAAKACSYTDASGRPVPAPRPFKPERADPDLHTIQPSSNPAPPAHDRDYSEDDGHTNPQSQNNPRKRFRNEHGSAIPTDDISTLPMMDSTIGIDRPAAVELDHALTRELTNLFFTHCHPCRAIIHKPTFSASLSHSRVPSHLLHAVCAVAAPLSKQPRIRTTPSRFAGKPFAQEALSLMFDGAGRLVCERNLATAQALCLLQIHDVSTKDKDMFWDSRYHDLALQIVESLNVHHPEYPTLTPVPSPEFIHASIERESVRRIFWLIHVLDTVASIYFKKPIISLGEQGMRLRLPADETSFELGVHSTLPEYLYLPAVRTQYASEFGHLIRVITIYAKVEYALDELNDPDTMMNPTSMLVEAEQMMEIWAGSLSEHLRFSEQNLQVQQSMFETSSNTGAWCYCCMHVYYASSALALNLARQRTQRGPKTEPQWALQMLDMIMTMLGDRAKNSILMGAALWAFIKYCKRDDAQVRTWCAEYEDSWGTRVQDLATEWRPQPSPPTQHSYSPTSHPQPHQQPHPHRRISDPRNPNLPISGPRPSSHQHDSSFTRRSPGSASPNSFPLGRSLDELRLHSNGNNNNGGRNVSSHAHPDREGGGRGHAGPGGGAALGPGSGQGQGGNGNGNGNGNENTNEREKEVNSRRPIHESGSEPTLQNGASGAGASGGASGGSGGNGGEGGGQRGSGGGAGDGPQSLPSLKASGLLDSWNSLRVDGGGRKPAVHGGNGAQRTSPRRSPPHLFSSQETDVRSTTLVSMPVGLQWLANESR